MWKHLSTSLVQLNCVLFIFTVTLSSPLQKNSIKGSQLKLIELWTMKQRFRMQMWSLSIRLWGPKRRRSLRWLQTTSTSYMGPVGFCLLSFLIVPEIISTFLYLVFQTVYYSLYWRSVSFYRFYSSVFVWIRIRSFSLYWPAQFQSLSMLYWNSWRTFAWWGTITRKSKGLRIHRQKSATFAVK